ncbi:MAG: D-alanine--D-alanine ligase [Clostridiales bacterium]|nr:D-alanine--D-alanine ligase [Clostridiales bacterium]
MGNKKSVLVLFGGVSSEHEVSRTSAASVLEHMDKNKYEISTIGITKEGNWFLTGSPVLRILDGTWEEDKTNKPVAISPFGDDGELLVKEGKDTYGKLKVDVVFPILHGKNGEDGTMQGLLQIAGLPFVGSDAASSAASMDKALTKAMVEQTKAACQAKCYVCQDKKEADEKEIIGFFQNKFPLFVKPANAGSSVGISKVKSAAGLKPALELAFREDSKVLVEEAIVGREIEVAVLGNNNPKASCIGEIFAANEFYDYNAKYENKASLTEIVKDLSPSKEKEIKDTALKVYKTMGCRGLARVDFFLEEGGRIIFNEINTLPGFTNISMYPKLWEASAIPYSELIDKLIELALEK